jgi:alpha-amylase
MSKRAIVLYLHAHQPFRLRHYTIFDAAQAHDYFDTDSGADYDNQKIINKVAAKSYLPTNKKLIELLEKHPEFHVNLSLSGVFLEQLERWAPEVLKSFQDLVKTGKVEIAAETYHHSLAFFYNLEEFKIQVEMHRRKLKELFDVEPTVFRNTELAYNNDLAKWAESAGYKGILAEGWDPVLGWKTSNYMYRPAGTENIRLLLKNYKLSDDIAFRFGNRDWKEWPLTADKFTHWLNNPMQQQAIKALYDYSNKIIDTGDWQLIEDWRKLQTSDHFYYMCTKWFSDGDVHAYFSPYKSPYEGFINFMNTYQDLRFRLSEKGAEV